MNAMIENDKRGPVSPKTKKTFAIKGISIPPALQQALVNPVPMALKEVIYISVVKGYNT